MPVTCQQISFVILFVTKSNNERFHECEYIYTLYYRVFQTRIPLLYTEQEDKIKSTSFMSQPPFL